MDPSWIWKAILIVFVGTALIRLSGRKSIAQMTLAPTVIMISIGSLLIQPVSGKNVWVAFTVGALLMGTLLFLEFIQVKFDKMESFISGKSKIVIENGILNTQNLKKLRLTVDQLEMQLRQKQVSSISDVKFATLESNGQVGIILQDDAQTITKKEYKQLMNEMASIKTLIQSKIPNTKVISHGQQPLPSTPNSSISKPQNQPDLFTEIKNKNQEEANHPNYLQ